MLKRHSNEAGHIDKLLEDAEQLQALKHYIDSTPGAAAYLDYRLYQLVDEASKLTPARITQCQNALNAGANPNYIHAERNESTLQAAAYAGQGTLIEMLIGHGADVLLYVPKKKISEDKMEIHGQSEKESNHIANMSLDEKNQEMIERGKLPLQKAIEASLKHKRDKAGENVKASKILSEKTIAALNIGPEIENTFKTLYELLAKRIHDAFRIAKENNQQVLIIVGEHHTGISSLTVELMLMHIAKSYGIKYVLNEHNKYMQETLEKHGYIPTCETEWSTSVTAHAHLKDLGYTAIPVDLGHWGAKKIGDKFDDYQDLRARPTGNSNTSPEAIRYRNEVMRDVITDGFKEDGLFICGAAHLYGLMEETPLPNHIHVCAIVPDVESMIVGQEERDEYDFKYPLESNRVLRIPTELDKFNNILSPEAVANYVLKTHQSYQPNNTAQSSTTQPTDFFNKNETGATASQAHYQATIEKI